MKENTHIRDAANIRNLTFFLMSVLAVLAIGKFIWNDPPLSKIPITNIGEWFFMLFVGYAIGKGLGDHNRKIQKEEDGSANRMMGRGRDAYKACNDIVEMVAGLGDVMAKSGQELAQIWRDSQDASQYKTLTELVDAAEEKWKGMRELLSNRTKLGVFTATAGAPITVSAVHSDDDDMAKYANQVAEAFVQFSEQRRKTYGLINDPSDVDSPSNDAAIEQSTNDLKESYKKLAHQLKVFFGEMGREHYDWVTSRPDMPLQSR